jgi:putative intracellular protease/amidase
MQKPLAGKKIALLIASGFEEVQMTEPQKALLALGASLKLVGPESLANGWHGDAWGHYFPVDQQLATMFSADFDMLVVPGGERSIAKLSLNPHTKRIVSAFIDDLKPVALLGNAVEILVTADRSGGVQVSGAPESRAALEAANAIWSEEPVTVCGNVLTGTGADLPLFIEEMTGLFVGREPVKDAA